MEPAGPVGGCRAWESGQCAAFCPCDEDMRAAGGMIPRALEEDAREQAPAEDLHRRLLGLRERARSVRGRG